MGGWHAFPGGGLSRKDAATAIAGEPQGAGSPPNLGLPSTLNDPEHPLEPNLAPGIATCALRELFEETGVLPLAPPLAAPFDRTKAQGLHQARKALLEKKTTFANLLREEDLLPEASRLIFAGRWMTPPLASLRFDNRFFLLEWKEDEALQPLILPGELAEGEWIAPGDGIALWERGEIITSPPILHLLRVLAEDGPQRGLPRLRDPSETNLGPLRRVEFRPGVVLLPLATPTLPPATHTNAFLLGHQEVVLVDPGSPLPGQIRVLEEALLDAQGRHGIQVKAIWLTHHHPDHVGGVEAARRLLGVPVCAHRATARRLAPLGISVDEPLEDGQRVVLGGKRPFPLRVFHTPGHAQGHLCFFDETYGSLIAGDLVAGFGTIVVDPPEGDMDQYIASLERMIELAPATLFPAHGPAAADAVGRLRRTHEHRLWREEKILAAWREGSRDAKAIVPLVYEKIPPQVHPLAARQVEAHLQRLRRRGTL